MVKRADSQKQENQVEAAALAVQLSWACWRIEQERPHSGNTLEAEVGTRFLSAAQVVERRREREKSSTASQRVVRRDDMVDQEEMRENPRRRPELKSELDWTGLDWGSCQWQSIF